MLKELIAELGEGDVELAFARVTTSLYGDLERNGIVELVGRDRFHETIAAGVADFLGRCAARVRRCGGAPLSRGREYQVNAPRTLRILPP